jgi:hypothetical protein
MNHAEWKDVFAMVASLIGRQSPPAQIFSWLLIVFVVLMVIEGLRATFLPHRVVAQIRRRNPPEIPFAGRESASPVAAGTPRRLLSAATSHNTKRIVRALSPHEPPRPTIRRVSSYFEYEDGSQDGLAPQIEADTRDPVLAEN